MKFSPKNTVGLVAIPLVFVLLGSAVYIAWRVYDMAGAGNEAASNEVVVDSGKKIIKNYKDYTFKIDPGWRFEVDGTETGTVYSYEESELQSGVRFQEGQFNMRFSILNNSGNGLTFDQYRAKYLSTDQVVKVKFGAYNAWEKTGVLDTKVYYVELFEGDYLLLLPTGRYEQEDLDGLISSFTYLPAM